MTYQEIAAHIRRMPLQERLELLDWPIKVQL